jgi:hypothetical protein
MAVVFVRANIVLEAIQHVAEALALHALNKASQAGLVCSRGSVGCLVIANPYRRRVCIHPRPRS